MNKRQSSPSPTPRKPAALRLADPGQYTLHAAWLEAAARQSDRVTISARFAVAIAGELRRRLRERAA